MTYTSLPVKYRPKIWDDVVGHATEITRLKGMIKSGKIPHALLFVGPSGVGKTTLAKIFASYVNGKKENPVELDTMDFTEVNGAEKRGIDDIRSLIEEASFMPASGKYRFIFLDEAQDLTSAAAKALLVPVENPPAHTIYIFSSMEPDKLLPALVGRCSVIDLRLPGIDEIASRIKRIARKEKADYIDSSAAKLIAEASAGQVRNAVAILESVIQFVEGTDNKDKDTDKVVKTAIKKVANLGDDLVAIKVLLSVYSGNVSSTHKALLDANDFNGLIQKLTYLNLFLMDHILANGHSKVWYTSSNKKFLEYLKEKLGQDLRSWAETVIIVQKELNQIKMDLGTFLATDRAIFSARLNDLAYKVKRKSK